MNKRKIGIVTGSRAEYGLLYWIIKKVRDDSDLELQLIVTGMHLSPEFGLTVKEIEKDGFPIAEKVDMLVSSDTEEAISASMGKGMIGFAKVYSSLKPDIVVVLGDRFEIHAAVSAAVPFRIPVAHIHGGESTEGAFDEQLRHAITKMSHIHFASTEQYRRRIIQMGEKPDSVFCFGSPAIDNILKISLMTRPELSATLNVPEEKNLGIFTYHPVTLECDTGESQIIELLEVIEEIDGVYWIFTSSNADTRGRMIMRRIKEFVKRFPEKTKLHTSLGQRGYLSLLKHASLMVGNSSSGLIEAPSFGVPVINIGDRQKGRIRAANVIDIGYFKKERFLKAVEKAFSHEFKEKMNDIKNPYGNETSSEKIVETLKNIELDKGLIKKEFYEFTSRNH